jgi:hypothetical protein
MKSQQFVIPEPIAPDTFCDFWIPRMLRSPQSRSQFCLQGLGELEPGYKAERVRFLQKLMAEKRDKTVYAWLKNPQECPLQVQLFLGALHLNWHRALIN